MHFILTVLLLFVKKVEKPTKFNDWDPCMEVIVPAIRTAIGRDGAAYHGCVIAVLSAWVRGAYFRKL